MADKAGIPSSVMRDGLSNKTLEFQARLAWKYACSSKFFNYIFTTFELCQFILKLEHSVNIRVDIQCFEAFLNPYPHYFGSIPSFRTTQIFIPIPTDYSHSLSRNAEKPVIFFYFHPASQRQFYNYPASRLSKWANPAPSEIFSSQILPLIIFLPFHIPLCLVPSRVPPNLCWFLPRDFAPRFFSRVTLW